MNTEAYLKFKKTREHMLRLDTKRGLKYKVCRDCGKEKRITEFTRNQRGGYRNQCRACATDYNRKSKEQPKAYKCIDEFLRR